MLARLIAAGLIVLALAGGYFLGSRGDEQRALLQSELSQVQSARDALTLRNQQLEQTLGLVKRQIQTDRIAYDKLQQSVDASEQRRATLQEQLAAQRALLDRLKQKIDNQ